jgi:hypothetical protein
VSPLPVSHLTTVWPKTTKQDLLLAYNVKTYLHKEFTRHIEGLMANIKVGFDLSTRETCRNCVWNIPGHALITCNGLTADTTSGGFLGVTMHWINVSDKGKLVFKLAVIGM